MTDQEHELLVALTRMTVAFYGTASPHHQFLSWGEAAFEQMVRYGLMERQPGTAIWEWTEAGKEFVTFDCNYDSFVREGWTPSLRSSES